MSGQLTDLTQLDCLKDSWKFVYIVFYFTGLTILFPFSMLISLTDFWNYKFRNTSIPFDNNNSSDVLTDMQKIFPAYISVTGNVPLTLLVVLTALFGWRISIRTRLLVSGTGMGLAFGVITILSGLSTDDWQEGLFVAVLAVNVVYSSFNALFQASFLGNIGRFPPRYIGSANDGIGLGAVVPALTNILILSLRPSPQYVGISCAVVALAVIFLMLVLYGLASRTEFYREHAGVSTPQKYPVVADYLDVLRRTWVYVAVTFLNYGISLAVYPAVAALVRPVSQESSPWNDTYFLPVCCFLLQSTVDWMGKSVATFSQFPPPGRPAEVSVALATLLRVVFVPLLMRCNVAPANRSTAVLFPSDAAYIGLFAAFSFTGGYLGNVASMLGPKKEVAGTILITALVFGLGVGSLVGPNLVNLL